MRFKRLSSLALCVLLVITSSGCGTILHPERKGQIDGQLDPSIVVLDALGLLFFLVPGVIAFAVDFSNGTIYLPGGESAQLSEDELDQVTSDDNSLDKPALERLLEARLDRPLDLNAENLEVRALDSQAQVERLMAREQLASHGF